MDQMLVIPTDRQRVNQPLLCAIMAGTLLLVLGTVGRAPEASLRIAQDAVQVQSAAEAPILLASR